MGKELLNRAETIAIEKKCFGVPQVALTKAWRGQCYAERGQYSKLFDSSSKPKKFVVDIFRNDTMKTSVPKI